jgi:lipopolysaccharide export LptBFGC system permease protein LptF
MAKRIVLVIAVTVFAVVAVVFAFKFYRHMTGGDENQPGIIFERTDRPSRA